MIDSRHSEERVDGDADPGGTEACPVDGDVSGVSPDPQHYHEELPKLSAHTERGGVEIVVTFKPRVFTKSNLQNYLVAMIELFY